MKVDVMTALCYRNLGCSKTCNLSLCIYGDPGDPGDPVILHVLLQAPYRMLIWHTTKKNITKPWIVNSSLIEWLFREIKTYFKFALFKSQMKIGLSAVAKTYFVYLFYLVYSKTLEYVHIEIKFLTNLLLTLQNLSSTLDKNVFMK